GGVERPDREAFGTELGEQGHAAYRARTDLAVPDELEDRLCGREPLLAAAEPLPRGHAAPRAPERRGRPQPSLTLPCRERPHLADRAAAVLAREPLWHR